jgi:molybdopterin synthase catalytic subunit/molybdopterin synthase sulfur carrier subunit
VLNINVRINGELARDLGTARLQVAVAEPATLADLLEQLRQQYPRSRPKLESAIPFSVGQHLPPTASLADGQEVALLMPVAGG